MQNRDNGLPAELLDPARRAKLGFDLAGKPTPVTPKTAARQLPVKLGGSGMISATMAPKAEAIPTKPIDRPGWLIPGGGNHVGDRGTYDLMDMGGAPALVPVAPDSPANTVTLSPDSPLPPEEPYSFKVAEIGAPPSPDAPPPAPSPSVAGIPATLSPPPEPDVTTIESPVSKVTAQRGAKQIEQLLARAKPQPAAGGAAHTFSLSDNSLHPLVLDMCFTALFGPEWHEWEHETLDHALAEIAETGGGTMSDVNRTKLQMVSVLHVSTYPWIMMTPFTKVAIGLDGRVPDSELLEVAYPGAMLCALQVMREVRPGQQFSHEVLRAIGVSCVDDGPLVFPDPEIGSLVNQVILRLCSRSIDPAEQAVLAELWQRISASDGGALALADRELDDIDESNLGDYQLSMAAKAATYAQEFEARKQAQLGSLAAWVGAVKR